MLVLEIVLVQLLIACAIALMCTLQLYVHALHWEQVIGQVHFTCRWNTYLARGIVIQIGSSLPSSFFYSWLVGLLTSIMDMWDGSRQLWGSWHAWLSTSLPSPPIFVTWNGAYWCIMAHTDIAIIHMSIFHHIRVSSNLDLLESGKDNENYLSNTITTNLGTTMCAKQWPFSTYSLDQTILPSCSR